MGNGSGDDGSMDELNHNKESPITGVGNGLAHAVIVYLVALLLSLPLFIILYPYVPEIVLPLGGGMRVDHVITFVMILIAFIVLVRKFQLAVYVVLIIGMLAITVTSLSGVYSLGDMYN